MSTNLPGHQLAPQRKSRQKKSCGQLRESSARAKWGAAQASEEARSGGGGEEQAADFSSGVLGGVIHEEPQDSDPRGDNDSDDSMRVRRTPSHSSSDADNSRRIGRLSLDGKSPPQSKQDMTQDRSSNIPPTVSKRSATEDLSNGPRKHSTPSSRGLQAASNVKRLSGAARGRNGPHARAAQRSSLPSSRPQGVPNNGHPAFKPILPRDSGYETSKSLPPSRQNTLPTPLMSSITRDSSMSETTPSHSTPSPSSPTGSEYSGMISQPASSPLSQQQLASEIKSIYAGLVMVEGKCINIDAAQAQANTPLGPEQWQALIALHRTLLYEHHDFMMATQHPVATDALKKLAIKYQMPARMWKHAIHAFLEVLRQRRPESHEYMLAFVYLAYQMMALLYETVTDFRDTWIECLGDLARYRMAIEDDKDVQHQWGNVASFWYNLTADANPGTGRLNHHMGILESPSLRKLYFYVKALTSLHPFQNGHESLATFFRSLLQEGKPKLKGTTVSRTMRFHAQAYSGANEAELQQTAAEALDRLSSENTTKIRDWGVYLAVSNVGLLLQWGNATNFLTQTYSNSNLARIQAKRPSNETAEAEAEATVTKKPQPLLPGTTSPPELFSDFAYSAFNNIIALGTDRQSVRDILPSVHAILVWLHSLNTIATPTDDEHTLNTISLLSSLKGFSWVGLCDCLNTLIRFDAISDEVMTPVRDAAEYDLNTMVPASPLPEDFVLSGLIWTQSYYPAKWMPVEPDPDTKSAETADTHRRRVCRVQTMALFLAAHCDFLHFDEEAKRFSAPTVTNMALRQSQPAPASVPENVQRDRASSTKSLSSAATYSVTSDSEGWGVVGRGKKGKKSYASTVSGSRPPGSDLDKMALDDD